MVLKSSFSSALLILISANSATAAIRGKGRRLATDIEGPCSKQALIDAGISAATLASEVGNDAAIEAACEAAFIGKTEM